MSLDPNRLNALSEPVQSHLLLNFGENGKRALDFLRQAEILLLSSLPGPRVAEATAYCLREALATLLRGFGKPGRWKALSRAVVAAKGDFVGNRGSLEVLLSRIDELADFHNDEAYQERRLRNAIRRNTGHDVLPTGSSLIGEYREILDRSNSGLHSSIKPSEVNDIWEAVILLLHHLFTPPEIRGSDIAALAQTAPRGDAIARAISVVITPEHLRRFLRSINDPAWLEPLTDAGLIGVDATGNPISILPVSVLLGPRYPRPVAQWLDRCCDGLSASSGNDGVIVDACAQVGVEAGHTLRKVISRINRTGLPVAQAVSAMAGIPPCHRIVHQVADILLNNFVSPERTGRKWGSSDVGACVSFMKDYFIAGIDSENGASRYRLLCLKLYKLCDDDDAVADLARMSGSVGDIDPVRDYFPLDVLVGFWTMAARHCVRDLGVMALIEEINAVSPALRTRLRTWLMTLDVAKTEELGIRHVAEGIHHRFPTGDDLRLVRLLACRDSFSRATEVWRLATGAPPLGTEAVAALSGDDPSVTCLRVRQWAAVVPDLVSTPWTDVLATLDGRYGPVDLSQIAMRPRADIRFGGSPISKDVLVARTVRDACRIVADWRPDPDRWNLNARGLARPIEELVVDDARSWSAAPMEIVSVLRQPTYIAPYLRGIGRAMTEKTGDDDLGSDTAGLVDAITLVMSTPWEVDPLGAAIFDYDSDWRGPRQEAVRLIEIMARTGHGFAGREDDVWRVLAAAVRDAEDPPRLREPKLGRNEGGEIVNAAYSWTPTRALAAVVAFAEWERRGSSGVRSEVFRLLDETLALGGVVGALHRATIVMHMHILRGISPEWMKSRMDRVFGDEAPSEELAALALSVVWQHADIVVERNVLDNYRDRVGAAVDRGDLHAFVGYMKAVLSDVPGYTIEAAVKCAMGGPERARRTGAILHTAIADSDGDEVMMARVIEFWGIAIERGDRTLLNGLGLLARAEQMDDDVWLNLTLRTMRAIEGEWTDVGRSHVARRTARLPLSPAVLGLMDELVRGCGQGGSLLVVAEGRKLLGRVSDVKETVLRETEGYRRLRSFLEEKGPPM